MIIELGIQCFFFFTIIRYSSSMFFYHTFISGFYAFALVEK